MYLLRLMLVGVGLDFFGYYFISSIIIFKVQLGLYWVLFYFSSIIIFKVQFSSWPVGNHH